MLLEGFGRGINGFGRVTDGTYMKAQMGKCRRRDVIGTDSWVEGLDMDTELMRWGVGGL